MGRVSGRQHLNVEGRVTLLEEDVDSVEQRQERHARDVRQIKALLWALVVALLTASILLGLDLANGSNLG